jgi:hypothetical protein
MQTKLSAAQQKIVNQLIDYVPALKKGQIHEVDGGDIQLGDLIQAALSAELASALVVPQGNVIVGDATGHGSNVSAKTSGNILVGNGTTVASVAVSGEATLASSGAVTLSNAAVIAKVLTAYAAASGVVSATDSILAAIQKIDGNEIAFEALFSQNLAVSIAFDHSIGATTCKAFKNKNVASLFIPTLTTADGLGTGILAAAGQIPAAFRPIADVRFPCVVTDNAAKVFGSVIIGANGSISFYKDAATTGFTNAAAAGVDGTCFTYNLA